MDAAVVTSSLQSFHVPSATSDSRLSAPHHCLSLSATSDEDVVQATSALLQDLDQSSTLSFSSYAQSSANHAVHSQAPATPQYDVRKDMSPFSQSFLRPSSDSGSPRLTTADGVATTSKDCIATLSQHIGVSPGSLEGHRVLSDPMSHFIVDCGTGAASVAEIEAAFSEALQDVSRSQYFRSPERSADHLTEQTKSPSTYQSVSSSQHIPGIAISMPEHQSLQGVPVNPSSGGTVQPTAKAEQQDNKKSNAPPPPPKKPLSPYMRFSKRVWQKVKTANPGMSVCEVGAAIGRIWRELSDTEKQHFIDEFNSDKARYDDEFQNYLRVTGLQASDLVKPRGKKKEPKEKQGASRSAKLQESQSVASVAPANHAALNHQERAAKPHGQPNETPTMGGMQQDAAFFANRPEGVNVDGLGSLPPFSQVWSNCEFLSGPDLLAQMVLGGQTRQQQQVESDATRISLDGKTQQMAKSYGDHGLVVSHEQQAVIQRPSASVNCGTSDLAAGTYTGHSDVGGRGWPWQQVSVSQQNSQGVEQSNEGVLVYQLPTNGTWPHNNINMAANQSDQNGALVLRSESEPPMMSTIQSPYGGGAPDGVNCVFQMASNAGCLTDDACKHGIVVDAEKLQLRNALLEKSEEVLRLMKELEQVYGLIHQLKQQNDFFHQQWNLHHNGHSTAKSSGELDGGGGTSTHGT